MIDTFLSFRTIFKEELNKGRRLALYPMGRDGLYARQMLEGLFGRKDFLMIDNNLCDYNKDIISFNQFKSMDISNLCVVITTTNFEVNKIIKRELDALKNTVFIRNVLVEPIVVERKDKREYFKKLYEVINIQSVMDEKSLSV